MFQARKQKIEAVGELTEDMKLTGEDRLHLVQIFGPVLLVLVLLLTPKDAVGCSWYSIMLGAVVDQSNGTCEITSLPWIIELFQNAAGDASAAGMVGGDAPAYPDVRRQILPCQTDEDL